MTDTKEPTCVDKIGAELAGRMKDIRVLLYMHDHGDPPDYDLDTGELLDACPIDCENLLEYGYSFDDVDGDQGYWRWQLSWGGPGDEFRFFTGDGGVDNIEYWFLYLDNTAKIRVTGDDFKVLARVYKILRGEE
jgi:hypothetical protein